MTFDIPIVVIFFKRKHKTVQIINRIKEVKPSKLYLISDGARNQEEQKLVHECRVAVEESIDWPCEIIKNYAEENEGVYNRIGLGAKWVLEREEYAIFLEDDNLPEITFFEYCRELLLKYKDDTRIFWICGTNYLGDYKSPNDASYVFTQHMLPCGWATWSNKFLKFYDGNLELYQDKYIRENLKYQYKRSALYKQHNYLIKSEYTRIMNNKRPGSWDYQMAFSIKVNNLLGIAPAKNQIKNIGVDQYSTHGGTSLNNPMTKRLTGMDSFALEFPLKHPLSVMVDGDFDRKTESTITMPLWYVLGIRGAKIIRKVLNISEGVSLSSKLFGLFDKLEK